MVKHWASGIIALSLFVSACSSSSDSTTPGNHFPQGNGRGLGSGENKGGVIQPSDAGLFPGEYFCRRDYFGNYGIYRMNDGKYVDVSNGSLEWCNARAPRADQRYFCRRDYFGNFALTHLPDLKPMDLSSGSMEFCLSRVPANDATYFCRREFSDNFAVVRLADGKQMDASAGSIDSCLASLPHK